MQKLPGVALTFAVSCAAGVLFFLLPMGFGAGPAHSLIGRVSAAPASQPPTATQLTTSAAPPVYFADDFDDGNADGWTVSGVGTWTVENGEYVVDMAGLYEGGSTSAGDVTWADYRLDVDLQSDRGDDQTILVRYQGEGTFYSIRLRSGFEDFWLERYVDGEVSTIGAGAFLSGRTGRNAVSVVVKGRNLKMFVNGELLFDHMDWDERWLDHGKIGFRGWNSARVCHDNVVVSALPRVFTTYLPALDLTWTLGQYLLLPTDCAFSSWSPDGSRIACLTRTADGLTLLNVVNNGGEDFHLVATLPFYNVEPDFLPFHRWSPTSNELLVLPHELDDPAMDRDLHVVTLNGRTSVDVSRGLFGESLAAWSPDGRWILFVAKTASDFSGEPELYVVGRDGTARARLSAGLGAVAKAGWSPDSRQILFQAGDGLYVVPVTGDGAKRLATMTLTAFYNTYQLAWSPDGKWIAYADVADGAWFMRADGSQLTNIPESRCCKVIWSPDSSRIVFANANHGHTIVTIATGEEKSLTTREYPIDLVWSPDGQWLAGRAGDFASWVFIVAADGSSESTLNPWPKPAPSSDPGQGILLSNRIPTWSADSRHLLIVINESSQHGSSYPSSGTTNPVPVAHILKYRYFPYIYDLDGDEWQAYGQTLESVALSPNGQWIGFSKEDGIHIVPVE